MIAGHADDDEPLDLSDLLAIDKPGGAGQSASAAKSNQGDEVPSAVDAVPEEDEERRSGIHAILIRFYISYYLA